MEASYQTAALTASGLSWAAVAGTRPLTAKLENERTTPRATFRRGQLSLQSNEIFGRTNPIPERSRRRASCAQAFVAGPAVFPLYFQRAVSSECVGFGIHIRFLVFDRNRQCAAFLVIRKRA